MTSVKEFEWVCDQDEFEQLLAQYRSGLWEDFDERQQRIIQEEIWAQTSWPAGEEVKVYLTFCQYDL
jgi:hypothetical protein